MKGATILAADDDLVALNLLEEVLRGEGYEVITSSGGAEAIQAAHNNSLDAALIDLRMPDFDGIHVMREILSLQKDVPVIVVTAFADMPSAMTAIHAGAYDFLSKPYGMAEIKTILRRALKARISAGTPGTAPMDPIDSANQSAETTLIGKSPAIISVYNQVARVSQIDVTVLLTGETGTGKEQVARAIHFGGGRAALPFAVFDCASVPELLFESELFGHERGAFTGAQAQRQGILETAGDGTCFVDEIGELPLTLQGKLLRVLQEKTIRRVGGNKAIPFHARIVAATNRDLGRMVSEGRFREDLFYRLDVIKIHLPPLRERLGDVPILADYFLSRLVKDGGTRIRIVPEAMARLEAYPWPGNVRQLENVIQRIAAMNPSSVLLPEYLPPEITAYLPNRGSLPAPDPTLHGVKLQHIIEALERAGGNKSRAAQILGIDRRTLYRILDRGKN